MKLVRFNETQIVLRAHDRTQRVRNPSHARERAYAYFTIYFSSYVRITHFFSFNVQLNIVGSQHCWA